MLVVKGGLYMGWIYLLLGGLAEIVWAVALNFCQGFKITPASTLCITGLALSIVFLWMAAQTIPISIAYAVWTGIAIVGVFAIGALFLHEPVQFMQVVFVTMILTGIVGLKLYTD